VNEEVNRDKTGEADGMDLEVDSKDEMMHERSVGLITFRRCTNLCSPMLAS